MAFLSKPKLEKPFLKWLFFSEHKLFICKNPLRVKFYILILILSVLVEVERMKHRKSLLVSIWVIALGIALWISGQVVGGMGIIYHAGGWFTSGWYEFTTMFYLGVGLAWSGIIALILGMFGIITTFIREYLDKEPKPIQPQS
jgi:hypothetical protein